MVAYIIKNNICNKKQRKQTKKRNWCYRMSSILHNVAHFLQQLHLATITSIASTLIVYAYKDVNSLYC